MMRSPTVLTRARRSHLANRPLADSGRRGATVVQLLVGSDCPVEPRVVETSSVHKQLVVHVPVGSLVPLDLAAFIEQ